MSYVIVCLFKFSPKYGFPNLVPSAFLVVARELRKTLVKYDEISKILGDLSHAQ
jgi:hypothetical protein